MARERRTQSEGEEERGRRRPEKKSPAGMFGLAIVLAVVGAAVGLFLLTKKKEAEAAPVPTEKVNPFADVPPEPPPEKHGPKKGQ